MRNSSDDTGSAVMVFGLLLAVILLLLIVGTGMTFMYLRQIAVRQQAAMQRDLAAAEEARARAEMARLEAEQSARAASSLPQNMPTTDTSLDGQSVEEEVVALLGAQQAAWTQGDIDEMLEAYWHSEELTVQANGSTIEGWQELADHFRETQAAVGMQQLEYRDVRVRLLGSATALVKGRVEYRGQAENQVRALSMLLQRMDERWIIVHQHESPIQ